MARRRGKWNWASQAAWKNLPQRDKAILMSLMEADGNDPIAARNAMGAIINRANRDGKSIGDHVSNYNTYQPLIEPKQLNRLHRLKKDKRYEGLGKFYDDRLSGKVADPVNGATHYLAHPSVMLGLERRNPRKYHNWGPRGANWTGYNEQTGKYANQTIQDNSHSFLAPEGLHSANYGYTELANAGQMPATGLDGAYAQSDTISTPQTNTAPEPSTWEAPPYQATPENPYPTAINPRTGQGGVSGVMTAGAGRMAPETQTPVSDAPMGTEAPIGDLPGEPSFWGSDLGGIVGQLLGIGGSTTKAPAAPAVNIKAAPTGGRGGQLDMGGLAALLKQRMKFGG